MFVILEKDNPLIGIFSFLSENYHFIRLELAQKCAKSSHYMF